MGCVLPLPGCKHEPTTALSAPTLSLEHLSASRGRRRHGAVAADGRAGDDELLAQRPLRGYFGGDPASRSASYYIHLHGRYRNNPHCGVFRHMDGHQNTLYIARCSAPLPRIRNTPKRGVCWHGQFGWHTTQRRTSSRSSASEAQRVLLHPSLYPWFAGFCEIP